MDRNLLNYFVDLGMAICFLISVITGLIKFPGLLRYVGLSYLPIPLGKISTVHDWSGVCLGAFVLLHLIFHWKWIVGVTKSFFTKKRYEEQ